MKSLQAHIRYSVPLLGLVLLGSCETFGGGTTHFDANNKTPVAEQLRGVQDEQSAILSDLENTGKLSTAIADTSGKPDQKLLDNFTERVETVNTRVEKYKGKLNDFEQSSLAMLQKWRDALTGIRDPELERTSRANLDQAKSSYDLLDAKLRDNYSNMARLAKDFRDQRVFMQVNPAVEASASLKEKLRPIEKDLKGMRGQVEEADKLAEAFRKKLQA